METRAGSLMQLPYADKQGNVGGAYAFKALSGNMSALAAGAIIGSFLMATKGFTALITAMRIGANVVTAFTAAQGLSFDNYICRPFTVNDSGGTAFAASRKRTSMSVSKANVQIFNTAALTQGTRTRETIPIYGEVLGATGLGVCVEAPSRDLPPSEDRPLILGYQEGLELVNNILMGAGGVVQYDWSMSWIELPNEIFYRYWGTV